MGSDAFFLMFFEVGETAIFGAVVSVAEVATVESGDGEFGDGFSAGSADVGHFLFFFFFCSDKR